MNSKGEIMCPEDEIALLKQFKNAEQMPRNQSLMKMIKQPDKKSLLARLPSFKKTNNMVSKNATDLQET